MKKSYSFIQKLTAAAAVLTMLAPALVLRADTPTTSARSLTDEQKILHVLNRLGFGARPGDVEKVKAMGLQKYIDEQLNPSSIDDSAAEAKVKGLDVFNMSTADLFAKYPNPGGLLRQLEGNKNAKAKANEPEAAVPPKSTDGDDMTVPAKDPQADRRAKLQAIYTEYNLKPAGQIIPEIVANRVLRDVYSERQLQEVMVDFWQNHFNVYAGKAAVRWYIPSYERDVLRPNALGNFKDLLVGTAEHPAMLFYLDNYQSVSPNAQPTQNRPTNANAQLRQQRRQDQILRNGGQLTPRQRERMMQNGRTEAELDARMLDRAKAPKPANQKKTQRGLNENYARELMELHTLGVDGGYTQNDIIEVAKCFTGWTIADPRGYAKTAASEIQGNEDQRVAKLKRQAGVPEDIESGEFYFNPRWHDNGTKTVLGQKINEGGMKDGLKVIDILVNSPATAKFIARKLAIKFVSDNPSEALVGRVADAFHNSKGDIKTTLRAIFTDKEFWSPATYRAKIKSPFELAVSSIRTLGANTNGGRALLAMLKKLGEIPYNYQAPTGYPDKAEDWVNTGALLERLNFAVAIASNRIPGTRVDLKRFDSPDKAKILDKAIATILDGDISPETRTTLLKQIEQPLPDVKAGDELTDSSLVAENMKGGKGRQAQLAQPTGDPEVFKIVSLVLGTPEFQRQ